MTWEPPTFEEICMSAEIGGYQADDAGDERRQEPVAEDREDASG